MSIEATDEIDLISVDENNNKVLLTIIDPLDWTNEEEHLFLLQDKINAYLTFIETGEIYEAYPASINKDFLIDISFEHEPNSACCIFLEKVKEILKSQGYDFDFDIKSS